MGWLWRLRLLFSSAIRCCTAWRISGGSTELHAANTLCCLATGRALKASLTCLAVFTPAAVGMAAPCDSMQLAMAATVALLIAERDRLGAADEGAAELAGGDVGEEPPQPATVG